MTQVAKKYTLLEKKLTTRIDRFKILNVNIILEIMKIGPFKFFSVAQKGLILRQMDLSEKQFKITIILKQKIIQKC
jgi:hypothetical protein